MDTSTHSAGTERVRRGSSDGDSSLPSMATEEDAKAGSGGGGSPGIGSRGLALPSALESPTVGLEDFDVLSKIGEGGYGKVVLARKKTSGALHAVKAVRKEKLLRAGENAVQHMLDENHILQSLRHPFILTLQYAFQDRERLYLVTNYVGGGDLHDLIERERVLSEAVARFYAAQLAAAFAYLHEHGVVYRDLKPENVLLGVDGYVVLADFGLAKTLVLGEEDTGAPRSPKSLGRTLGTKSLDSFPARAARRHRASIHKAETFCGTPLYLAPEVVSRTPYGRSVDWWALGCLLVEMLTGKPPFLAKDLVELMDLIRAGDPECLASDKLSEDARSVCGGLLARSPGDRLGCGEGGVRRLMGHAFFEAIDWPDLEAKRLPAPFLPDPTTDMIGAMAPPLDVDPAPREAGRPPCLFMDSFRPFNRDDEFDAGLLGHSDFHEYGSAVERSPTAKLRANELNDAARDGDLPRLRALVLGGAPVTLCDYDRRTPLHVAASSGRVDAVAFLVGAGKG